MLYCSILVYSSDLQGQYNYIDWTTESAISGGFAKLTGKHLFNKIIPATFSGIGVHIEIFAIEKNFLHIIPYLYFNIFSSKPSEVILFFSVISQVSNLNWSSSNLNLFEGNHHTIMKALNLFAECSTFLRVWS